MALGAVGADRLAVTLLGFEPADSGGAEDKGDEQRRHHRAAGAEGEVAEQVEDVDLMRELGKVI